MEKRWLKGPFEALFNTIAAPFMPMFISKLRHKRMKPFAGG